MKKTFTQIFVRLLLICVAALTGMAFTPIPVRADSVHPVYKITFGGRGESTTVDQVLVENLSNGQSVELRGNDVLLLKDKNDMSAINEVQASKGGEVSLDDGRLFVRMQQSAEVQVDVYGIDGRKAWQTKLAASSGRTPVTLPPLGKGVYVVRVAAPGFSKSIKWMCGVSTSFAAPSFSMMEEANAEVRPTVTPLPAVLAADNASQNVVMEFATGDVLRLTGTSGDMRTIITNSPRSSHPLYFDFFKCQDANGYNYTIVRAGDMMWMAEDLRRVNSKDFTYANSLSQDVLNSVIGKADVSLVATNGDQAYYSKAAAVKALPEGWQLPTQGELDYAIKKLNGGDYNTVGAYFKGTTQVDTTSLCLTTSGRYNGNVADGDNGYLMTRSTRGGVMLAMQFGKDDDKVSMSTNQNYLIPVRGVRAAPSAYNEMMEAFGFAEKKKAASVPFALPIEEFGPLGKTYTMYDGGQSIAFDYSGGQYNDAKAEARSGILYKEETSGWNWKFDETRDANFLSDGGDYGKEKLRKMAAMSNGQGTQYVVEMQWNRPFRVVTEYKNNSYQRTDTPDVFSRGHEDGVFITIAGDHNDKYAVKNKQTGWTNRYGFYLDLKAYMQPLPKSILKYDLWDDDNRPTEVRVDYVQRVFQLLTADFNKDGVDELVIGIDGEVWVYDGAKMLEAVKAGNIDKYYTDQPLYHKDFRINVDGSEQNYSSYWLKKLMTRFAVGDVDGDGIPDITVLRVGLGGENKQSKGEIRVYGAGRLDQAPVANKVLATDWTNAIFNDVKVGNVSGSKYNDIIVLPRNYTDNGTTLTKSAYLWRVIYDPNETGNLKVDFRKDYNVGSFRGFDLHMGNTNVTLAHFRGREYPCDIVVGADLWRWNEDNQKLEFQFQVLPFTDNEMWSILADNIITADPRGEGYDILYYFRHWSTYGNKGKDRYMFQGFSETWFSKNQGMTANDVKHSDNFNSAHFKYCNKGESFSSALKELELMWWFGSGDAEWGNSAALCAAYTRPGAKVLKYKGHQTSFSEPRIHALLAAPPTYVYEKGDDPGYDFVTSWGFSKSTSMETTQSSSITASTIVGFEQDINAPLVGTKLGGIDFTMKMQNECSKGTSTGQALSYTQLYEARDDDRVVMQATPYDIYTYEVVNSTNVDEIGGELNLSIPQKTMTVGLALSDYDRLMGDAKGVPNLHEVFHHTVGNPFSYPSTVEQIRSNVKGAQILWGNGDSNDFVTTGSGGSVIREISLDESKAQTAAFSFGVETELVVTALGVKAGCGFGFNNTNETRHEESSGFTVSACVPGLSPVDTSRRFFKWNMCWYKYTLNGQTFPVVNYVVKER